MHSPMRSCSKRPSTPWPRPSIPSWMSKNPNQVPTLESLIQLVLYEERKRASGLGSRSSSPPPGILPEGMPSRESQRVRRRCLLHGDPFRPRRRSLRRRASSAERRPGALRLPMDAILLVDHGSRRAEANEKLEELSVALGSHLAALGQPVLVTHAHMELAEPSIAARVAELAERGVTSIVCVPCFLARGRHVSEDIPQQFASAGRLSKARFSDGGTALGAARLPRLLGTRGRPLTGSLPSLAGVFH